MDHPQTVRQARQHLTEALHAAGIEEAALEAVRFLEAATGLDRLHQVTEADRPLQAAEQDQLATWLHARRSRQPLAQILGSTEFYGLRFEVTETVLCPRPETELLVDWVLQTVPTQPPGQRIADLGTGSGAIAVAVAHHRPDLQVIASDRSPEALAVARRNADAHGLTITWRQGDWLAGWPSAEHGTFAVVVSNPPYIPEAVWRELEPEVRNFEPQGALVGGADGLDPYRVLPAQAMAFLQPGGSLAVELGIDQAERVMALFTAAGYEAVGALPDLAGIPRLVFGRKPG